MKKFKTITHGLIVTAGLSAASLMGAGTGNAMVAHGDDAGQEAADTPDKKIRIVKSGGAAVVVHADDNLTHAASRARAKAVEDVQAALEKVQAQLKKARKGGEREALEAAETGLEQALEAMKSAATHASYAFSNMPDRESFRKIEIRALEEALADMENQMEDLGHMRVELAVDLAEAHDDIAEAMSELEIEFDFDADFREEHARSLEEAKRELGRAEEYQIEGLKRAEEQLKRQRESLERKLEERRRQHEEQEGN